MAAKAPTPRSSPSSLTSLCRRPQGDKRWGDLPCRFSDPEGVAVDVVRWNGKPLLHLLTSAAMNRVPVAGKDDSYETIYLHFDDHRCALPHGLRNEHEAGTARIG